MRAPRETGSIHFVGIGGIGMSGIAESLVKLGYRAQGSDLAHAATVARLRGARIQVSVGHAAAHVCEAAERGRSTAGAADQHDVGR